MAKSRPLTPEESERIVHWLNERWTESRKCPVSGHDDWEIQDRIVYHFTALPGEILWSKELAIYPSVMIVCKGCGYTVLFSASAMGITSPPEAKENG